MLIARLNFQLVASMSIGDVRTMFARTKVGLSILKFINISNIKIYKE